MSEINVVPYIDVMLVLLVIFMVTAPLMTQGIKVDLPDASSGPIEVDEADQPLVVSIQADGTYFMNIGDESQTVTLKMIFDRTERIIRANPDLKVLVEGDENLKYGHVIELMNVLQEAGAANVGLITEPPGDRSS